MLRSMYSGVTGMRSFQTKMDVIANNIANVNTTGFKSGRARFQDLISQTTANAQNPMAGDGQLGGINPQQIGLGVRVGSIDNMMSNGALQPTNRSLDFAIEGEGFFIVGTGVEKFYTRDGAFYTDFQGNLVNSNGQRVYGYMAEEGTSIVNRAVNDEGERIDPEPWIDPLTGQLDKDAIEDPATGEDGLVELRIPQFVDEDGNIDINGEYELQSFSIDGTGMIIGAYSDGDTSITFTIGQIAMAKFQNSEGLEKVGNNNFKVSNNSGEVDRGLAGSPGYGVVRQGFLEMSNVDLANEFTEMIITSRAYQANSRSITTSDEMLQELINLKR